MIFYIITFLAGFAFGAMTLSFFLGKYDSNPIRKEAEDEVKKLLKEKDIKVK